MATAAWFGERLASTQVASADLSLKQFYFVTVGSSGVALNVTLGAGALKVLGNAPKTNEPAYLHDIGETKLIAGGSITAGGLIMSDATGKAVAYVNNGANVAVGEARMTASSGDVFTGFIFPTASASAISAGTSSGTLTAAGSTRTDALALTAQFNQVDTTGSGTGVVLPAAVLGMPPVFIANAGANTLAVYAAGSDTINGTAGATGLTMATTKNAIFFVAEAAKYRMVLTA